MIQLCVLVCGIALIFLGMIGLACLAISFAVERKVDKVSCAILKNRYYISELSSQIYSLRDRQLVDSVKIADINRFCEDYAWDLVHFTEKELADLAKDEAERHDD